MNKTLDLSSLRSFVAVADIGGVTAAAGKLNLTQSAVSMQIKRLETLLGRQLIARQGRVIELTVHGEQLLDYGRQILGINDEVWNRMTHETFEGKLAIGVPPYILYPHIPRILKEFSDAFPRVEVKLISTRTAELKEEFAKEQTGFDSDHRIRNCQGRRKAGILSAEMVLPARQQPNMEKAAVTAGL